MRRGAVLLPPLPDARGGSGWRLDEDATDTPPSDNERDCVEVRKGVYTNMAARCDVCHRKPQYGSKVSHSNRHTNRRFEVNVQHRRLVIDGRPRNVYVCTRCLRNMVKVQKAR